MKVWPYRKPPPANAIVKAIFCKQESFDESTAVFLTVSFTDGGRAPEDVQVQCELCDVVLGPPSEDHMPAIKHLYDTARLEEQNNRELRAAQVVLTQRYSPPVPPPAPVLAPRNQSSEGRKRKDQLDSAGASRRRRTESESDKDNEYPLAQVTQLKADMRSMKKNAERMGRLLEDAQKSAEEAEAQAAAAKKSAESAEERVKQLETRLAEQGQQLQQLQLQQQQQLNNMNALQMAEYNLRMMPFLVARSNIPHQPGM